MKFSAEGSAFSSDGVGKAKVDADFGDTYADEIKAGIGLILGAVVRTVGVSVACTVLPAAGTAIVAASTAYLVGNFGLNIYQRVRSQD